MYGSDDYDDGECTASPGVMGHKACHRYPGCGCGQSKTDPEFSGPQREVMVSVSGVTFPVTVPVHWTDEEAQRYIDKIEKQ